jgi:hypothetical protein
MRNSMQRSQSHENQNAAATTRWIANATVASLPVLACFLGGATQKWEEGLVITILALCLLVRPPRFSLGMLTNLVLLTLFILAAVAFLPARWFFQPEWRGAIVNDFGIQLPSTLTPQPWITLGYLISFAAGLSWLYVVSTISYGRFIWPPMYLSRTSRRPEAHLGSLPPVFWPDLCPSSGKTKCGAAHASCVSESRRC